MDIRVQRIGDANNNMNRIINANIRCGRISNPTERRNAARQVTNYYPFGTPFTSAGAVLGEDVHPYKYNGKELDRMHGLDTYDYGARQYDPILTRWDRVDPLCEKYYSVSPYAYCNNNPTNMIDTNGMDGIAIVDYDNKMISISQTFYYNMNSEGLINNAIVASREINNSRFGQTTISAEIDAVKENGFSSKVWNVNDWSVSFKCEFIGLDSDEAVSNALQSNPEANALRYDEKLGANGVWDSNTRTLTLGPNRGGWGLSGVLLLIMK